MGASVVIARYIEQSNLLRLRSYRNEEQRRPEREGGQWRVSRIKGDSRTYLRRGNNVRDHIMALKPPMTSSVEGAGPLGGQIPFRTYKGDVPMSLYMIPRGLNNQTKIIPVKGIARDIT